MEVNIYRKTRTTIVMTARDGYPIEIVGDKAIRSISDRLNLRHNQCVGLPVGENVNTNINECLWDKEHKLVR